MTWAIPTAEEQVRFLRNIQRLLAEGLFTASYKFAVLYALGDLAGKKGDDSGAPLDLHSQAVKARQRNGYQEAGSFFEPLAFQQG